MFDFLKRVYAFAKKFLLPLVFAIVGMYFVRFVLYVIRQAGWQGSALIIVADLFYTIMMMSAFMAGAIALIKKNKKLFRAFFVIVFSAMFFNSISSVFSFIRYFIGYGAISVINAILISLSATAVVLVGVLTAVNYVKGEKKYAEIIDVAVAVYIVLKTISFILLLVASIVNGNLQAENVVSLINILQAFLFVAVYDDISGRFDGLNTVKESVSESSEQSEKSDNTKQNATGETVKESATEEPEKERAEESVTEEAINEEIKEESAGDVGEEVEEGQSEKAEETKVDTENPKKAKRGLFSRKK